MLTFIGWITKINWVTKLTNTRGKTSSGVNRMMLGKTESWRVAMTVGGQLREERRVKITSWKTTECWTMEAQLCVKPDAVVVLSVCRKGQKRTWNEVSFSFSSHPGPRKAIVICFDVWHKIKCKEQVLTMKNEDNIYFVFRVTCLGDQPNERRMKRLEMARPCSPLLIINSRPCYIFYWAFHCLISFPSQPLKPSVLFSSQRFDPSQMLLAQKITGQVVFLYFILWRSVYHPRLPKAWMIIKVTV